MSTTRLITLASTLLPTRPLKTFIPQLKPRLLSKFLAVLSLVMSVLVVVGMAYSVRLSYSPLLWVDQWTFLQQLVANHGHYNLALLWRQHNEHRMPFPKLFFLADFYLFGARNIFVLSCIFLIQLLHVGWLGFLYKRLGKLPSTAFYTALAVTAASFFWFTQTENFWFVFDLQVVLSYFGATLALSGLALLGSRFKADGHVSIGFLLLSWSGACIASLSLSNGFLLWPLLILTMLLWRVPFVVAASSAAATGLLVGAWVVGYTWSHTGPLPPISSLVQYLSLLYGSSWSIINEPLGRALAVVAVPIVVLAYIWFVLLQRGRDVFATLILSTLVFILSSSLMTAVGRLNMGIEQARASRYQAAAMSFWCLLTVLILCQLPKLSPRKNSIALILVQGAWLYAMFQAIKVEPAVADGARLYASSVRAARAALQFGVLDPSAIMFVTTPPYHPEDILVLSNFLRLRNWSLFSVPAGPALGRDMNRYYNVVAPASCAGSLDAVAGLPNYRWSGFRIGGWAYDLRRSAPARSILVVDDLDRVVGGGLVGFSSPSASSMLPLAHNAANSGFLAYIPADLKVPEIRTYALLSDGVSACPLDNGRPVHLDLASAQYTGPASTGATKDLTRATTDALMDANSIGSAPLMRAVPTIAIRGSEQTVLKGCIVDSQNHTGRAADVTIDGVPFRASYGYRNPDSARNLSLLATLPCGFEAALPPLPAGTHQLTMRVISAHQDLYFESRSLRLVVH